MSNQNQTPPVETESGAVRDENPGRSQSGGGMPAKDWNKRLKRYESALIILCAFILVALCFGIFKAIQNHSLKEHVSELEAKIHSVETESSEYRKTIESLENTLAGLESAAAEAEEKNAGLKKEKQTLLKRNQELTEEQRVLQTALDKVQGENDTLGNLKKQQEKRISELSSRLSEIGEIKDKLEKDRNELAGRLKNFKVSMKKAKTLIDQMAGEIDQLAPSEPGSDG